MVLIRWVISALSVILVEYIVPGIHVSTFWTALLVALVLGIVNLIIRPLLILLTLPVTVITLGLFIFVINAAMLLLTETIVKGFEVDGFAAALLGALVLWLINWIVNGVLLKDRGRTRRVV